MAYLDNVTNILQIQPDGLPTYVRLSQNENGRNLYFELQGNEADIPANATITISGTKPDGVVYSGTGSCTDNVVLIPETVQMTAVAGTWDAKIQITSGGNTIATGRVRFVVDADTVAPGSVPSDSELEGLVAQAQQYAETARTEAYGSPLTASTAASMTDHTRVYVYTGSESGYTAGHWYFWNGSAWTDGGIYNSVAVNTDPTLKLSGVAADAKATGDAIAAVTIETDKTLSVSDAPADAKVVGDEIASLKSDLTQLRSDVFESGTPGEYPHKTVSEFFSNSYPLGTSYPPSTDSISIVDIESYNSWYVTVSEAMDIFFDSSLDIGTFIIGKISNVTSIEPRSGSIIFHGSNPARYRYADGEGFPTENDKLHLNANDTVIISLQLAVSPNNVVIYYGERQQGDMVLNEDVMLNETQINQVIEALPDPGEFPYSAKRALLNCIRNLAWTTDEGQDYYEDLVEALNMDEHLDSITATFNQNDAAIYNTNSLESLKPYLVVNANYADGSTAVVSDYVLSGTLTVGNCTITVSYEGKTTTFVVKCIAYFDHVTVDGVSYDISLSGNAPYKFLIKLGDNNLYLYYADHHFYLRGAFQESPSQDSKYITNIYGSTLRGVQSGTSFESQGIVGMTAVDVWGVIHNYNDSNVGDIGREASPRTLSQIKWSLNDICLYDNGYTDTIVYPATT